MLEIRDNSAVLCERRRSIALITINRPAVRNAISTEVTTLLSQIAESIEADEAVRAVVLTGAGDKAFCAGADLGEVASGGLERLFTPLGGFAGLVRLERSTPWLAAVNGVAFAGGLELMLACDFAVAASHATFALPEVKRGLFAAAGGAFRLPRSVPRAVALRMLTTGDAIDAAQAHQHGLITEICNSSSVLNRAMELAEQIADNAPLAIAASLRLARAAHALDEEHLWEMSSKVQVALSESEDFKEGPRAYIEKRKPLWSGK
jgi:enoyl-CoA hydratase/carnithine racemase